MNELIESIASFVGGFLVGYLARIVMERIQRKGTLLDRKNIEEVVSLVIVSVWTVSTLVSIAIPERHTPIELHLLMGGVFGILFKGSNPILESITKRINVTDDKRGKGDKGSN